MIFVATKYGGTKIIFPPPLLVLLLDPGSEILHPGWIKKIKIRDNHPDPQHWGGGGAPVRSGTGPQLRSFKQEKSLQMFFQHARYHMFENTGRI
jgi:hypothetical protein